MTRLSNFIAGAALGLAPLAGGAALAHHSYSMFDMNKTVVLDATVEQFRWSNPHAFIRVQVPTRQGSELWSIEMTSPNNLIQEGWNRSTLKKGDRVQLYVHPLRSGALGGSYAGVKLANGSTLGDVN